MPGIHFSVRLLTLAVVLFGVAFGGFEGGRRWERQHPPDPFAGKSYETVITSITDAPIRRLGARPTLKVTSTHESLASWINAPVGGFEGGRRCECECSANPFAGKSYRSVSDFNGETSIAHSDESPESLPFWIYSYQLPPPQW